MCDPSCACVLEAGREEGREGKSEYLLQLVYGENEAKVRESAGEGKNRSLLELAFPQSSEGPGLGSIPPSAPIPLCAAAITTMLLAWLGADSKAPPSFKHLSQLCLSLSFFIMQVPTLAKWQQMGESIWGLRELFAFCLTPPPSV